jgi:hypothetical protein
MQPIWPGGRAVDERGLARAEEVNRRISSPTRRRSAPRRGFQESQLKAAAVMAMRIMAAAWRAGEFDSVGSFMPVIEDGLLVERDIAAHKLKIVRVEAAFLDLGGIGKPNRCIVPATSFCEYADTKPRKTPKWFALSEDGPLFAFAGLWTPWHGVRGPKSAPVDGQHELFGFLTTEPNAVVAPIHPKAMPVILITPAEIDLWLLADASKALELQRPLPDDALQIVASGEKEDGAREEAVPDWDQDPVLPL